ncbi:hypothetical protein IB267_17500 [Ensifer sp. ENS09]|uniref:PDC sensor domain-containing protein n=1 Tax=Ensifer sp. ENS09 TaxID=2769263 RepID=UPI001786C531|nr:hypothetical protein [Ensifer sp. ENS09]MBD9650150.1 hypothetical protein [Ensifer sp. ENS09]
MFAALVVLLSLWIYESYRSSLLRSEECAAAASKIVATNASWINALAIQALRRIDDTLGPTLGVASDEVADINLAVADLPGQVQAYVVDRNGRTLFSTNPNIKPIDIRDRPYFSALAAGKSSFLSGLLVSRLNNQQIFVVSRAPGTGRNICGRGDGFFRRQVAQGSLGGGVPRGQFDGQPDTKHGDPTRVFDPETESARGVDLKIARAKQPLNRR